MDIAEMHLVGPFQHFGGRGVFLVEESLAAAGKNQQVGIVAGGVALHFLQPVDDRKRLMQGRSIFSQTAKQAGQAVARLGIVSQVIGVIRVLREPDGLFPEVFGQFVLAQMIIGVALPVIALAFGKLSGLTQAVCQTLDPCIISCL